MNNLIPFPNSIPTLPKPFHAATPRLPQANPLHKRRKKLLFHQPECSPTVAIFLVLCHHQKDPSKAALRVQQFLAAHSKISTGHLELAEELAQEMKLYSARNFLRDHRLRIKND